MKKINQLLLFFASLLFVSSLQSCRDDDSEIPPVAMPYSHILSYSHVENVEFKMWTNGAEVNTNGLDFMDFIIDENDAYYLSTEFLESGTGLGFTEDSIFFLDAAGKPGHPFIVSNDTVYMQIVGYNGGDSVVDVFVGLGSPNYIITTQGFAQYARLDTNDNTTINLSYSRGVFQTFDKVSEYWDIPSFQSIREGDTLIINNRYFHYN